MQAAVFKVLFYGPLRQLLTFKNSLAFLFQTSQEDTDQNRTSDGGEFWLCNWYSIVQNMFFLLPHEGTTLAKNSLILTLFWKWLYLLLEQIIVWWQWAHHVSLRYILGKSCWWPTTSKLKDNEDLSEQRETCVSKINLNDVFDKTVSQYIELLNFDWKICNG